MQRLIAGILSLAAVSWTLAVFCVPLRADRVSPVLSSVVYSMGALVCHQRPERSFHIHGAQLPVCARCTGLYLAGALGALVAWVGRAVYPRRRRAVILTALVPTVATLAIEWSGLGAPSNLVRAGAALPLGAVAGWLFVRMLRSESSQAHAVQSPGLER
jgi:uncharacterized membrane protein